MIEPRGVAENELTAEAEWRRGKLCFDIIIAFIRAIRGKKITGKRDAELLLKNVATDFMDRSLWNTPHSSVPPWLRISWFAILFDFLL